MSLETEALWRCERLLAMLSEAMTMEHALVARTVGADAATRSVIKPILDDALVHLEPLLTCRSHRTLAECVREFIDLELELDAAFVARGWRVPRSDHDDGPPVLNDPT
ncbi:MAG: hypothetical protein O9345_04080 [Burkholderiaceae bacterium]|nr:hypothetical protein [Burkholderiales bacterium]MCZ8099217.1 hypothetical protein [Burkholderiales bacterium]MCZ8337326.1 hypothetical protein [Burkholderiaceae bacterium]